MASNFGSRLQTGLALELRVEPPFRLDLTAALLRRFETNAVDRLTPGGAYLRAFGREPNDPVAVVRQTGEAALTLSIDGDGEPEAFEPVVRRMLGLDADPAAFFERAARVPWLRDVVSMMRGARPPRYPSLWEACVNAVVFQQVSIASASAMLRRAIVALSPARVVDGETLHGFPPAAVIAACSPAGLAGYGLSSAKSLALLRIAGAILDGSLSEAELAPLPSREISARLTRIKGVGPWTAAIVLLRGFGRLDVFPEGDSGAARSLAMLAPGADERSVAQAREALGDMEGMLYYTLLAGRLAARGVIRPSPATADGL
jgi:DNA-3-methyladenine glycosylase II